MGRLGEISWWLVPGLLLLLQGVCLTGHVYASESTPRRRSTDRFILLGRRGFSWLTPHHSPSKKKEQGVNPATQEAPQLEKEISCALHTSVNGERDQSAVSNEEKATVKREKTTPSSRRTGQVELGSAAEPASAEISHHGLQCVERDFTPDGGDQRASEEGPGGISRPRVYTVLCAEQLLKAIFRIRTASPKLRVESRQQLVQRNTLQQAVLHVSELMNAVLRHAESVLQMEAATMKGAEHFETALRVAMKRHRDAHLLYTIKLKDTEPASAIPFLESTTSILVDLLSHTWLPERRETLEGLQFARTCIAYGEGATLCQVMACLMQLCLSLAEIAWDVRRKETAAPRFAPESYEVKVPDVVRRWHRRNRARLHKGELSYHRPPQSLILTVSLDKTHLCNLRGRCETIDQWPYRLCRRNDDTQVSRDQLTASNSASRRRTHAVVEPPRGHKRSLPRLRSDLDGVLDQNIHFLAKQSDLATDVIGAPVGFPEDSARPSASLRFVHGMPWKNFFAINDMRPRHPLRSSKEPTVVAPLVCLTAEARVYCPSAN